MWREPNRPVVRPAIQETVARHMAQALKPDKADAEIVGPPFGAGERGINVWGKANRPVVRPAIQETVAGKMTQTLDKDIAPAGIVSPPPCTGKGGDIAIGSQTNGPLQCAPVQEPVPLQGTLRIREQQCR